MSDDAEPILDIRDLRAEFHGASGTIRVLDGVSLRIMPGETVGVVGESGSGKSLTALSVLRLLPESCAVTHGTVRFRGQDILRMKESEVADLRGRAISMVFQDPMTSLNPVLRIARQIIEAMQAHGLRDKRAAARRAIALLASMGVSSPERALRSFPHQFSGGMRQRVMLAIGFANNPALLIADEPTTALDVTIQAQILDLLRRMNAEHGTAIMLISHNLGAIASACSRIVVMYAGEVVEEGPADELLTAPHHPYTWALVNAVPRIDDTRTEDKRLTVIDGLPPDPADWPAGCRFAARCPFRVAACDTHPDLLPVPGGRAVRCWVTQAGASLPDRRVREAATATNPTAAAPVPVEADPLLEIRGVIKHFLLPTGLFAPSAKIHAVDGIDLTVKRGETVGVVGESGCGKSTLARLIARIHRPDAGEIRFAGVEISQASRAAIRPLRQRMQMVFQDPYASLNPQMSVRAMLSEPLRFHGLARSTKAADVRVAELLDLVGLAQSAAEKYPHEFSGGQRQRLSIARALAVSPELIIADEPVSALDVNIQAQVLNLFADLQERLGLTYLFIAHDLAVVRHVSDRIVVLYLGRVMEQAPAADLFAAPLHPYTVSLIAAVPVPDARVERSRRHILLSGELPSAINPPSGCRFRTRCPIAQEVCATRTPALVEHRPRHFAACHFAGTL